MAEQGQGAVLAATVMELLSGRPTSVVWVVDLRSYVIGDPSAAEGNPPWWGEILAKLRQRLETTTFDHPKTWFRILVYHMLANGQEARSWWSVDNWFNMIEMLSITAPYGRWQLMSDIDLYGRVMHPCADWTWDQPF